MVNIDVLDNSQTVLLGDNHIPISAVADMNCVKFGIDHMGVGPIQIWFEEEILSNWEITMKLHSDSLGFTGWDAPQLCSVDDSMGWLGIWLNHQFNHGMFATSD